MKNLGSIISAQGWMQGSIFREQDLAELKNSGSGQEWETVEVGVVVSQSCDLCHHDPEGEPFAEVLVAGIVDSLNGNFTHGEHPFPLEFSE